MGKGATADLEGEVFAAELPVGRVAREVGGSEARSSEVKNEVKNEAKVEEVGGEAQSKEAALGPEAKAKASARLETQPSRIGAVADIAMGSDTLPEARLPEPAFDGWPQPTAPYLHPALPRKVLACRYEALERRVAELEQKPGDPRAEVARVRLEETGREVKRAGGRTSQKLGYALLEGRKESLRAGKDLEAATAALLVAQRRADEALQERKKSRSVGAGQRN